MVYLDWNLLGTSLVKIFSNPIFLLTIAFLISWIILKTLKKPAEYDYFIHFVFLSLSFIFWIFLAPYSSQSVMSLAVFSAILFLIMAENFTVQDVKVIFIFLTIALIAVFLISSIFFPIINTLNPQPIYHLILLDLDTHYFYVALLAFAFSSFFLGFCWMRNLDLLTNELGIQHSKMTITKTAFVYYQIVPLTLLPIVIVQGLGKVELLERVTFTLNPLLSSFILLFFYSVALAVLGDRILKTKFLWVSSIFTIISIGSVLYAAFQYVLWEVDYGGWALAFVLVPLISYVSGIAASRTFRN